MWKKCGIIYCPSNKWGWDFSHAYPPVANIQKNFWRIYFSSRDKNNISRTSFIDVEPSNPKKIIYENPKPIIELGDLGSFDELGISPTCMVDKNENEKILYYIGRSVKKTVSFENFIGAASSFDGGKTFSKIAGPIFGKDQTDPYFSATLHIVLLKKELLYKGFYMSGLRWENLDQRAEPIYTLKSAYSNDGITWIKCGEALKLKDDEGGICQCSIIYLEDKYKMWYCYRKKLNYRNDANCSYRIGYAESSDLISWVRKDEDKENTLKISDQGWDSQMVCYPYVFEFDKKLWMIYNGNGFGKTGFGFAVYE